MMPYRGTSSPGLRRPLVALLAVLALSQLTACPLLETFLADEIQQVEQKAEEIKSDIQNAPNKVAKAVAAPSEEETPDDSYKRPDLNARRDPFIFEPPLAVAEKRDEARVLEPLENYEINQLRLVGLVTGTAVPRAMFLDKDTFGHIAKEGDRIGRDGGRITEIRQNEVEITIAKDSGLPTEPGQDQADGQDNEPVTIIIRLSDTEIETPQETTEEEDELLEKIEKGGAKAPASPQQGGGDPAPPAEAVP